MRIFHQHLLAAKVLISDSEADEIVFHAVSPLATVSTLKPVLKDPRTIEGSSKYRQPIATTNLVGRSTS